MTKTLTRRNALHLGAAAGAAAAFSPLAAPMAFGNTLEKTALKFGFIKLTDMAPIAIAKEKGFFAQYGIADVEIEAQANWKVLLDGVIDGVLDGAHMLAGQPIGANIGFGRQADLITPFSMDLNGNGITVSNEIWERMKPNIPKDADGKPIQRRFRCVISRLCRPPTGFVEVCPCLRKSALSCGERRRGTPTKTGVQPARTAPTLSA